MTEDEEAVRKKDQHDVEDHRDGKNVGIGGDNDDLASSASRMWPFGSMMKEISTSIRSRNSRTSSQQQQEEELVVEEIEIFDENPKSTSSTTGNVVRRGISFSSPPSPSSPSNKFGFEKQLSSFTNQSSWKSTASTVQEHFTLSNPASTINLGEKEAIVIVENLEQITLERIGNQIVAKQTSLGSPGLFLMRCAYTFVAIFLSVIIFASCIQISLYLFLGVAIESGEVL